MFRYILRRMGYGLLILIGVNLLTFFLFFTVNTPDDMARLNIGGKRITQEQIDKWKAERGYDRPLYYNEAAQGAEKITRTVLWERSVSLMLLDFGRSDSARSTDIGHEVATRMGVSLQLALPLFILQLIVSVSFSLMLVYFRHSRIDFWGVVLCVLMLSISSLFYIIVGQFFFSRVLRLVPISGFASGLDAVRFLALPIFLSLLARLGGEARLYRAMFLEEIGRDYVRTARAKGLSEAVVLFRHVLRNALIPIITSAGAYLPYVFMGSLVFESFFGIPGLGAFVIEAISGQDFAIVRTMVFLGSLLYIATFILIDVAYSWADPRVRLALALSNVAKGKGAPALAELRAVAAADKGTTGDMALINVLIRSNDMPGALKAVDNLAAKLPNDALPDQLRGRIALQTKDTAAARKHFEAGLAKNADYLPALAGLAALDLADKQPAAAKTRFEAALQRNPKNTGAMLALAELTARAGGKPDEVAKWLTDAVAADPTDATARMLLVDHHLGNNATKAAQDAAQAGLVALPDNPELRMDALITRLAEKNKSLASAKN